MALQLNFSICVINSCTQIRFQETTGFYSTANTGGWGPPNIDLNDAVTATLAITPYNSTSTYTLNLLATTLFPTDNSSFTYDIPLSSIGNPSNIVDGKWLFVYTITDGTNTYTKSIYKYFYCNSECCVTSMLPDIDTCDCCKETSEYKNYILAWTQLQSLKKAAACGDSTNFAAIKKIVDKLCLNSGCKTCK
jgi:hypothetical protein